MTNNGAARKNKGRQKVKMERMEKDSNRQVTFSKRRCGLFKKASELCTLTGAEAAIIVFSPGRKVFSFGHPCVETIVDRFLLAGHPPQDEDENENEDQDLEMQQEDQIQDLNMELTMMNKRIEDERKRNEELIATRKARAEHYWWDVPLEELGLQELKNLKTILEELKKHVFQHGNKLLMIETANNPNPPPFMGMLGPTPMVGYTIDGTFYAPRLCLLL